jgi:hypothetical protein
MPPFLSDRSYALLTNCTVGSFRCVSMIMAAHPLCDA